MTVGGRDQVTALAYEADRLARMGATLVLAHGAGAGQSSAFMVRFAEGLASHGVDVLTFNFPYTERRRRVPDRTDVLEACYRAAIAALQALREAGIRIGSNINLNRSNHRDLEPLYERLRAVGISSWQVQLTAPLGRAAWRLSVDALRSAPPEQQGVRLTGAKRRLLAEQPTVISNRFFPEEFVQGCYSDHINFFRFCVSIFKCLVNRLCRKTSGHLCPGQPLFMYRVQDGPVLYQRCPAGHAVGYSQDLHELLIPQRGCRNASVHPP